VTTHPTQRFSDRADHYAEHRPGYPPQVGAFLQGELGQGGPWAIADVGSGTGILTELLLKIGEPVFAVEPNDAMRAMAEKRLGKHPAFRSISATAEATGLADASVSLVAVGQAFHWFDRAKAKIEFARILKPGGLVALIWNERRDAKAAFGAAYQAMITDFRGDGSAESYRTLVGGDYAAFKEFFAPSGFKIAEFENFQTMDFAGLAGRVLSTSSMPLAGHARHNTLMERLRKIFDEFQSGGTVRIEYDTRVYHGRLGA
jgi:ubiquinone/menaquinone biosynthesis C-methylase UbiE